MDKRLVIEAYKAACILIDWSESIPNKSCHKDKGAHLDLDLEEDLNRWAFLENLFRDDLLYYDQIEEPSRLKAVMASLDLALLLTTRKKDRVSIRRERRKLSGWLKRRYGITSAKEGGTLLDSAFEAEMPIAEALGGLIELLPKLQRSWSEAGADGMNDYLLIAWLCGRHRWLDGQEDVTKK